MKLTCILVVLFLVLLSSALGTGCSLSSPGSLSIDQVVPDFNLPDINGQNTALSSYLGKVVVVNFWMSTCQPCRDEMPYFQELYENWKSRGIVLLLIDIGESSDTVRGFLRSMGLTLPVLLDSQGEVAGKYGIRFTPTTLFVDKEGKLKSEVVGAFKESTAIQNQLASFID
jgi:peroxiredoxin